MKKVVLLFTLVILFCSLNLNNNLIAENILPDSVIANVFCTITCPDDIYVEILPSESEAIVTYVVTTSMCAGGAVQISGLPSGSGFSVGTTSNCFQADDGMGNTTTCCFDVNVSVSQVMCPYDYYGHCGQSSDPADIAQFASPEFAWPTLAGEAIDPDFDCFHADFTDNLSSLCGEGVHIQRNWTLFDGCSFNFQFCTQIIELSDDEAPVIQCPDDYQVPCDAYDPDEAELPQVADQCGSDYSLSFSDSPPQNCLGSGYTITRIWTVTDDCDNSSSCAMLIDIICRPTEQASHISFSGVTSNQMTLEWFPGNGTGRIVYINTSNNFPTPPDGFDPLPMTAVQNPLVAPQVIFYGDGNLGNTVTVTGLNPGTTYWFRVFEYSDCSGENLYITSPAVGNPKSQMTETSNDPSLVVPSQILSPLPSISSPGLYQSNLPYILWNATIPFPCIQPFKCKDMIWNQTPINNYSTPGELIPYASTCFSNLMNNWEFRQRGFITGVNGNACSTKPCSNTNPTISHSEFACSSKDDRYAWDARYPLKSQNEVGICVFAVAAGDVTYMSQNAIRISHPKNCVSNCWYSWYDNINPTTGLTSVLENQHIGHIKWMDGPHLHFGVYYKNPAGKLISVNRPIIPNYSNISGNPYTSSNIKGTCLGSWISGATIYFKKENIWFLGGQTNEYGRFEFTTVPGIVSGDSMMVVANGYKTLELKLDSTILTKSNIQLPLIESNSLTGVIRPYFKAIQPLPIYPDKDIEIKVGGENYLTYDVIKINDLEEEAEYIPLLTGLDFADSLITIALPDTGINRIGIIYMGNDTILLSKLFYYQPLLAGSCAVVLNLDSSALGAKLYFDGQFLKDIKSDQEALDITCGEHYLLFTRTGYRDFSLTFTDEPELFINLQPYPDSIYSQEDSCVFNFKNGDDIIYCNNMTISDSSRSSELIVKQYYRDWEGISITSVSRMAEFRVKNFNQGVNLKCAIAYDQPLELVTDSIYLLAIYNDSSYHKQFFGVDDSISYDPSSQKVNYYKLNFGNGIYEKEGFVVARKQYPLLLPYSPLNINYGQKIPVPLSQLFIDPDSIPGDMSYQISDNNIEISSFLEGDTIYLNADQCFSGTTFLEVTAIHDNLPLSTILTVTINPPILPEIILNGSPLVCNGDSILLLSTFGESFLWSTGEITDSIWATESGGYYVTVIDTNGCLTTSLPIEISIQAPLDSEIEVIGNLNLCEGDSTSLEASPGYNYQWSTGDVTQSIIVKESGQYHVILSDSSGCTGVSDTLSILVYSLPVVDLGPDTIVGVPYLLDAGPGSISLTWNTGDSTQTIIVNSTGWYSVTVTDSQGCQAADSVFVEIITGTIAIENQHSFKIFPNPNSGSFTISGEAGITGQLEVKVLNLVGQSVYEAGPEVIQGHFEKAIELGNPAPGIYYVLLHFGFKQYGAKVVIQ